MPDKEPTRTVMEEDDMIDEAILAMLLGESSHRPWAVEEVAREIGKDADDSLRRLYGCGLIHRLDGFVWATHAAVRADEIRM
jgi:hypothetical protein